MTSTCPHCRQPGIANLAKRWSSRGAPATCPHCGGLSHVLASISSGITMGGVLIVVLFAIAAGASGQWVLIVPGIALAVAHNLWAWRRAKLYPIARDSVTHARAANGLIAGLLVLFGLN